MNSSGERISNIILLKPIYCQSADAVEVLRKFHEQKQRDEERQKIIDEMKRKRSERGSDGEIFIPMKKAKN